MQLLGVKNDASQTNFWRKFKATTIDLTALKGNFNTIPWSLHPTSILMIISKLMQTDGSKWLQKEKGYFDAIERILEHVN